MRMTEFRLQNYKSVEDTRWIKCANMITFVGKNESGKSAIFRGLSKLNPSDGKKYDGLKEFPRRRLVAEFDKKDWPVASVNFELEKEDKDELEKISSILKGISNVIVTRFYSNNYTIEFQPKKEFSELTVADYTNALKSWQAKVEKAMVEEGKGERLGQIKTALLGAFDNANQQLEGKETTESVESKVVSEVSKVLTSNLNEDWEQKLFSSIISENEKFLAKTNIKDELGKAEDWILKNMPQFIYFDRYDVLDSAIHIDDFITKINKDPDDPKIRITKCLFEHVGLDIEKISALDPTDKEKTISKLRRMADERAIQMSSASAVMTKNFEDWWEQRDHKFRYDIDGPNFRVWVSDNLDPSEIELDQRSAGMQYFFSFYLVFLVESKKAHVNSILLLDEPGLQYHGTAQQKIVEFLEKISKDNQILYTTHSPFMIDGDRLDDVRIVYEDVNNYGATKVSEDVWPTDKDALFPLQAGLGYSIAQTLFYSKYQLVVEGLTDYSIFKAMNVLLSKKSMQTLDSDIVITPAGGTRNLMPLASMLIGNEIKIASFLDGDQPGLERKKVLKEKLLVDCILVTDYSKKKNAEIEDLFDEGLYLDAVKESYPDKELDFSEEEKKIESIIDRVEALFNRKNWGFEKWRPANVIVDWIQQDSDKHKISDETCKSFESICKKANEILKKTDDK